MREKQLISPLEVYTDQLHRHLTLLKKAGFNCTFENNILISVEFINDKDPIASWESHLNDEISHGNIQKEETPVFEETFNFILTKLH